MRNGKTETFTSIHIYLAWDRQRLVTTLAAVLKHIDAGEITNAQRSFAHFERGMRRHIRLYEEVALQLYAYDRTGESKGQPLTMRIQRAELIKTLDEMQKALQPLNADAFRAAHDTLTRLLTEHDAHENNVLPYVDALLGAVEAERFVARLRNE